MYLNRLAKENDPAKMAEAIKSGVDANSKDEDGNIALHVAAKYGRPAIAKLLIEYGADINAENNNGYTPLYIAIRERHTEVLHVLIRAGVNIDIKSASDWTPPHRAVHQTDTEHISTLIAGGADPDLKTDIGLTPLHIAAIHGRVDIIQMLIAAGATPRYPYLHSSPLYAAASMGNIEATQFLITACANKDDVQSLFDKASANNNIEVIQTLVSAGVSVNGVEGSSWAALHRVARFGRTEIAKFLIAAGADVNAKDRDGATPLHLAAENNKVEMIEVLIAAGADICAKTNNDLTPLYVAIDNCRLEACRSLINAGADYGRRRFFSPRAISFAKKGSGKDNEKFLKGLRELIEGVEDLHRNQQAPTKRSSVSPADNKVRANTILNQKAQTVAEQTEKLETLEIVLMQNLAFRFDENSITYNKYSSTVAVAKKEILLNLKKVSLVANSLSALESTSKDFGPLLANKQLTINEHLKKNDELIAELGDLLVALVNMDFANDNREEIKNEIRQVKEMIAEYNSIE